LILIPVLCAWVVLGAVCAVVFGRALGHADAVQRPAPFVPVEPEAVVETDPRYEQISLFDPADVPMEAEPAVAVVIAA
jgi:hypothetical protein